MRSFFVVLVLALGCFADAVGVGQQGELQGIYDGNSLRGVERGLSTYLNGDMIKSILTPGEFCEWKLDLKAGEVVVAEATTDAFDPALEIVDQEGAVLSKNDDRYPGDQRPLLFWRCERDGSYRLHVRSYKDKAGGPVYVRFKTYDTVDLSSVQMVEREVDCNAPFLLRIPMKAGQMKTILGEAGGQGHLAFEFNVVIYPNGLPEVGPWADVSPAIYPLIAPLAGDYYLMETPKGNGASRGTVRVGTREIVPAKAVREGDVYRAKAPTNVPGLWELSVKAGEFTEISIPDLNRSCNITLSEAPDFSKYAIDDQKPELNPFFPLLRNRPPDPGPAFDLLPKREWDGRILAFRARRDAKLWLATDGAGPVDKQFTVTVKPAAADFMADKTDTGKLTIADTDYWAFDAKAGDVLNLNTTTPAFYEIVIVRDPDLNEIRHAESLSAFENTPNDWRMVVQKPGRYLVAVSCHGNGGGGEYSLWRKVIHPAEFSRSEPAKGQIGDGQVQVWRFTATPNDPLLIHWNSTNWSYGVEIYNDRGERTDFEHQDLDAHNRFGILKVAQPQTFVIVLTGAKEAASYSIELGAVPGFKPGKGV